MTNVILLFLGSLIKVFLFIALLSWIIFLLIVLFFKIFNPQRLNWIKYQIFKRPYDEKSVEWCMEAVQQKMTESEVKKYLLLNKISKPKVEELIYIYKNIKSELIKGGDIEHGRPEENNGKIELPKISKNRNYNNS